MQIRDLYFPFYAIFSQKVYALNKEYLEFY